MRDPFVLLRRHSIALLVTALALVFTLILWPVTVRTVFPCVRAMLSSSPLRSPGSRRLQRVVVSPDSPSPLAHRRPVKTTRAKIPGVFRDLSANFVITILRKVFGMAQPCAAATHLWMLLPSAVVDTAR